LAKNRFWDHLQNYVIIIDKSNRGSIAKISRMGIEKRLGKEQVAN